ncbi:hypothetical protein [Aeromonas phage Akh-2]|nr:hypothetical protein [Aeromonas phage Akh-2]
MCECKSYNKDIGSVDEVILESPDLWLSDGRDTICVDACIASVISGLWSSGLPTLNCCCGHNLENPSLVIPASENPESYFKALKVLDSRDWDIYKWELVKYKSS